MRIQNKDDAAAFICRMIINATMASEKELRQALEQAREIEDPEIRSWCIEVTENFLNAGEDRQRRDKLGAMYLTKLNQKLRDSSM